MTIFTKEELFFLQEKCRFSTNKTSDGLSISIAQLQSGGIEAYLREIQPFLHAEDTSVTASLLMKRIAFLAVNVLVSFSAYNKAIKLNKHHIYIDDYVDSGMWLPKIRFEQLELMETHVDRHETREKLYQQLMSDILAPVVQVLSKESRISRLTLWENVMIYIYWTYETLLPSMNVEGIAEDFEALLQAPPEWFLLNKNPVLNFHSDKLMIEEKLIRVRKTCCFYYKANSEGKKCSTCPNRCCEIQKEG